MSDKVNKIIALLLGFKIFEIEFYFDPGFKLVKFKQSNVHIEFIS